jgi:hypothetical protein
LRFMTWLVMIPKKIEKGLTMFHKGSNFFHGFNYFIMVIFVSECFASCILCGLCSTCIINVPFVPYRHSKGLLKVYCFIKVWGFHLIQNQMVVPILMCLSCFINFWYGFNCIISELALVFHLLYHVQNSLENGWYIVFD